MSAKERKINQRVIIMEILKRGGVKLMQPYDWCMCMVMNRDLTVSFTTKNVEEITWTIEIFL